MSHSVREKQKLMNRLRRVRGQMDAIERALDDELGCDKVVHMIARYRGAINGMLAEVIEVHVRTHLVDREKDLGVFKEVAIDHVVEVAHN
jgi:DNA-binding FrmR family transcriptional regulator